MSTVQVSVGIPAHDNAATITATIESLRHQTLSDWDCFVSCDSSSSETLDAARASIDGDTRFTLSINRDHPGVAGNWNEVLTRASSPLFKLLCADDLLFPNALEIQMSAMMANPSAVLCAGRRGIIDSRGRTLLKDRGLKGAAALMTLDDLVRKILRAGTNPLGEPSFTLYRTEALRRAGGFSTRWKYTIDLASYLEVLQLGDLVNVDATIGQFRVSSTSWSSTLGAQQSSEMRAVLDYALSISSLRVSPINLALAKSKVLSMSLARRIFSRLNSLGH
jgi:glycosyltransferase involved in cell wall biosynthesis